MDNNVIINPMTVDEAKACIVAIHERVSEVRRLVYELFMRDGWKVLGYHSWRECVISEFGEYTERHLYRILDVAQIEAGLTHESEKPEIGVIPQRHLEEIGRLESPDEQRRAWIVANETAPNGRMTYKHVQRIVDEMRGIERTPTAEPNSTLEDTPPSLPDFNYKRDVKSNRLADEYIPQGYDACQTPPYAIDPLLPYLSREWRIWEPAMGEGLLVEALYDSSFYDVTGTDILTGQNFFEYQPDKWDCLLTNPPYSLKYRWLERCYQLGKPFALLVPVEMLGAKRAQALMKQYSFEIMLLNRRINFKMPNAGWNGGGSQFATMWFCWQLLPQPVMFGDIVYDDSHEIEVHDETD